MEFQAHAQNLLKCLHSWDLATHPKISGIFVTHCPPDTFFKILKIPLTAKKNLHSGEKQLSICNPENPQ
jgi:hypothetical protein